MIHQTNVRAFGASVLLAVMCGCAGGGSTPPVSGAEFSSLPVSQANAVTRSAKVPPVLVYVTDDGTNQVSVYTYPAFKLYRTNSFGVACTDTAGDVWSFQGSQIVEYAHGGTVPIRTLQDPLSFPVGCAVSPSDGTLAVASFVSTGDGPGSIALFAHAKGKPKIIQGAPRTYFITFDSHDNLFGDGEGASYNFELFELAKGAETTQTISLVGATVDFPGNVQYTKNVLNIVDQEASINYEARVSGKTATVTGETPLTGASDCGATYIYTDRLFCADAGNADLEVYPYPKGGKAVKVLTGLSEPTGVLVSAVQK